MCALAVASDRMYSFLAIAVLLSHISRRLELCKTRVRVMFVAQNDVKHCPLIDIKFLNF